MRVMAKWLSIHKIRYAYFHCNMNASCVDPLRWRWLGRNAKYSPYTFLLVVRSNKFAMSDTRSIVAVHLMENCKHGKVAVEKRRSEQDSEIVETRMHSKSR